MNRDLILLHLSLIDGVGPVTIQNLLKSSPEGFDLQQVYSLKSPDFVRLFGLSNNIASKLWMGLQDFSVIERELGLMLKNYVNFLTVESHDYPHLLKNIYAPPVVIYVKSSRENFEDGSWKSTLNYEKKIAFVGSRKADSYGQKIVENIIPDIVSNSWITVSGGAIGADTMAHACTVVHGGKTISVIGSGLANPYPSSNKKLFEEILAKGGLIISPFGMESVARPGNFPARNRIIAGLSLGCVVVQAAMHSGASITAHFALDQGREVFAVPGPIYDQLSLGCHELIQNGAKLISCAEDILIEFPAHKFFIKRSLQNNSFEKSEKSIMDQGQNNCENIENIDMQVGKDSEKFATIKQSLKENRQKSKNSKCENNKGKQYKNILSPYKIDSLEFEILKVCSKPCSLDEIAVATNKEIDSLHEVLFDMQIDGQIKQNYAGMFELV